MTESIKRVSLGDIQFNVRFADLHEYVNLVKPTYLQSNAPIKGHFIDKTPAEIERAIKDCLSEKVEPSVESTAYKVAYSICVSRRVFLPVIVDRNFNVVDGTIRDYALRKLYEANPNVNISIPYIVLENVDTLSGDKREAVLARLLAILVNAYRHGSSVISDYGAYGKYTPNALPTMLELIELLSALEPNNAKKWLDYIQSARSLVKPPQSMLNMVILSTSLSPSDVNNILSVLLSTRKNDVVNAIKQGIEYAASAEAKPLTAPAPAPAPTEEEKEEVVVSVGAGGQAQAPAQPQPQPMPKPATAPTPTPPPPVTTTPQPQPVTHPTPAPAPTAPAPTAVSAQRPAPQPTTPQPPPSPTPMPEEEEESERLIASLPPNLQRIVNMVRQPEARFSIAKLVSNMLRGRDMPTEEEVRYLVQLYWAIRESATESDYEDRMKTYEDFANTFPMMIKLMRDLGFDAETKARDVFISGKGVVVVDAGVKNELQSARRAYLEFLLKQGNALPTRNVYAYDMDILGAFIEMVSRAVTRFGKQAVDVLKEIAEAGRLPIVSDEEGRKKKKAVDPDVEKARLIITSLKDSTDPNIRKAIEELEHAVENIIRRLPKEDEYEEPGAIPKALWLDLYEMINEAKKQPRKYPTWEATTTQ